LASSLIIWKGVHELPRNEEGILAMHARVSLKKSLNKDKNN